MRRLVVVLGAAALLGLSAAPALAEEPFRLEDQVVDQADVLGDESDIDAALEELQTEDGIQLFVVFVDSFDGMDTNTWMQSTEELSGLSGNDALLAVAVEDGAYGFDVPDGADVTLAEADQLAGQAVEPEFADGDWSAGVVAFADIVRTGEAPDSGDGGGGGALLVLGAIAVVGGGGYLLARSRRRKRAALPPPVQRIEKPDPYAGTTTEELQGRASNALLQLDEAMKTSQLDLDYARAQYGEQAVVGFDQALTQSRDELSRAFTIRQQLDDDVPEDEPTTRQMLGEMLRLTQAAGTRLDEQAAAFAQLRDLENTAPQVLDALAPRIAELHARLPQEEQRLAAAAAALRRLGGRPGGRQRHRGAGAAGRGRAGGRGGAGGARLAGAGDGGRRHPGRRGRRRPDRHPAGRRGPAGHRSGRGGRPRRRGAGRDGEGPRGGPVAHRDGRPQRIAPADRAGRVGADLGRRRARRRRSPIRWRPCGSWRRPTSRWSRRCRSRGTRRCRTGGPRRPWSRR